MRQRALSGYGPLHIRAELGMHGLGDDLVAAAMDEWDGDWAESARELVCRRYGEAGPDGLDQRRKAAAMLARRGFPADCIRAATRYDPEDCEGGGC